MVPWEVEFTNEFGAWWADDADQAIRNDLEAAVELLMEYGPALGRPVVDTIRDSRYLNMRVAGAELGSAHTHVFAFDPRRVAILLIGGDKTGKPRFYTEMTPLADRLYEEHLLAIKT